MKTNTTILALAIFSISTLFVACKKEEVRPMNLSDKTEMQQPASRAMADYQLAPKDMLVRGSWKIPNYNGSTAFKDYIFLFNEYHVVFAKSRGGSYTGKWNLFSSPNGVTTVVIDFGVKPFIALNNSWVLRSYSASYFNFDGNVGGQRTALNLVAASDYAK